MLNAWLQPRSALVFFLYLPWFPLPPLSSSAAQPQTVAVETGAVGESQTAASIAEESLLLPGVVIEEIPKGSALEKAGLQVGDVILSWERLPNPPANPEGVKGELTSYFDWQELEVEQVPRGRVMLRGRRSGKTLELNIEPGIWEAKVRPILPLALDKIFEQGKSQLNSGNLERAVEAWQALADNVLNGNNRDLRTWILLRIGEAHGEKGQWEKMSEMARKAITVADSPEAKAAAWEASGAAKEGMNQLKDAYDDFSHALEIREDLQPISLASASGMALLAAVGWEIGEIELAQKYFQRSLQIQEQLAPNSLSAATGMNNLGFAARILGDLDRAAALQQKATEIKQQLAPDSLTLAASLNNLATTEVDRRNLDNAHALYLKALQLCEHIDPDSLTVAQIANNLGNVAQERKEFSRAHNYYSRALRIQEQTAPGSLGLATTLGNLGGLAWERGMLKEARAYYLQSLQIRQRVSPGSLTVAISLNNLGAVARDSGDFDRALTYFSQALKMRERLAPGSLGVSSILNNIGNIKQARKEFEAAKDFYLRSLQIEERFAPQGKGVAESLNHLGTIARGEGDLFAAYSYYSRAIDALEHQLSTLGGSYKVQGGFRSRYGDFYLDLIDILVTQGRHAEAFHIHERSRAQTFLSMLSERDLAFTADIPAELDRERRRAAALYDSAVRKFAGLNPSEHTKEIETIRTEIRRLESESGDIEARIRKAAPRLAALKYPKPLHKDESQQALDPGTLLLAYSIGKEKTIIFVLSRSEDLQVKILPLGEETLRSKVKQLLSLIRETAQSSSVGTLRQHQFQAISREIYDALLGPVAEQIVGSERLLILPDGPLHALPFAALLRDGRASKEPNASQYLAEWKPLHVVLSTTVFAELKQRRRPASESDSPKAQLQLAAFGDPMYPQSLTKIRGNSLPVLPTVSGVTAQIHAPLGDPVVRSAMERGIFDWRPLPYTRHEVEVIARLFPVGNARTFLGHEALEDSIKSLDPKTRILHLAAHGYTDEHLPSNSFVALTIPEDIISADANPERDNGLLQVWEIFERVRLDADLVVLSACDSGLGEEQGGEGLIGLTRAFQYAGARTVMASLWSVQDQATSELMIHFYKHLRAGKTKDEALRQAQIELIRGPIEVVNEKGEKTLFDASAPYYWAGFQVYGDWQ